MVTITSVQDGDWNDAGTWDGSAVPTSDDTVRIDHRVTIDADASAELIIIGDGSLTTPPSWAMDAKAVLTVGGIEMERRLTDDRVVRLDGLTLNIGRASVTAMGTYASDGFPTTDGIRWTEGQVIIADVGILGHTSEMQDIKPEGCARGYARKTRNGVRYMTTVVKIKADLGYLIGQLYRMAEGPFQVLAVTYSTVIKGHIENITPADSVGEEFRTFRITVAEGL